MSSTYKLTHSAEPGRYPWNLYSKKDGCNYAFTGFITAIRFALRWDKIERELDV